MAIIHLATINAPLFDHAGLKLVPRWSEVEIDELDQDGRFAIEKYAGGPKLDAPHRIIMVHPMDADLYASICSANEAARGAPTTSPRGQRSKQDKP